MTWEFTRVARIEQNLQRWYSLVTLTKAGVEESFFLKFGAVQPTQAEAAAAGTDLALRKNLDEARTIPRILSRQEFMERFTAAELAGVIAAVPATPAIAVFLKRLELFDNIDLDSDPIRLGVQAVRTASIITVARALQVLA